jgi:hypothetical protein
MKRFGRYNNDFNGLFECYAKVGTIVERDLPSITRELEGPSTGDSFPGAQYVKIFIQKIGRGADLAHLARINSIDSDNGDGGAVISGEDGDKKIHIITTKDSTQVRVVDIAGAIENDFITPTPTRYDNNSKEITIIQVEEV